MEISNEEMMAMLNEPSKTPKPIQRRPMENLKGDAMFILAQQGLKAKDICDLVPGNIEMVKNKVLVVVNGKKAELPFEDAVVLGKYMRRYKDLIEISGYVFYSLKKTKWEPIAVTKSFQKYLRSHKNLDLHDLDWEYIGRAKKPILPPIDTPEQLAEIFRGFRKAKDTK